MAIAKHHQAARRHAHYKGSFLDVYSFDGFVPLEMCGSDVSHDCNACWCKLYEVMDMACFIGAILQNQNPRVGPRKRFPQCVQWQWREQNKASCPIVRVLLFPQNRQANTVIAIIVTWGCSGYAHIRSGGSLHKD